MPRPSWSSRFGSRALPAELSSLPCRFKRRSLRHRADRSGRHAPSVMNSHRSNSVVTSVSCSNSVTVAAA